MAVGVLLMSLAGLGITASEVHGQDAPENRADWENFERFSSDELDRFVHSTAVSPNWINETDSLWYSWEDSDGTRFRLVVPDGPERRDLFDHEEMAAQLSEELETYLEAHELPIENLEFDEEELERIRFEAEEVEFEFHLDTQELENLGEIDEDEEEEDREWKDWAPDSTAYVYAEEHDLYFVEVDEAEDEEGEAVRLTDDGEEYYSFGYREVDEDKDEEDIEPEDHRVRPGVNWSEDSQAFSVTRSDRRHLDKLYLVDVLEEPRPTLEEYRYAMPGEEDVPQTELHAFDRNEVELEPLEVDEWPDQHLLHIHWTNGDSEKLRMTRRVRSRRALELIEVDMASGDIELLVSESVDRGKARPQQPRYMGEDNSGDFIWYSRRTGWAHFYRYSHDGELQNPVTQGSWNVMGIDDVDRDRGEIWFTGVGREEGEHLSYQHLYRAEPDGSSLLLVDEGDADHRSSVSPNHEYVLNTHSRVDRSPESVLRDRDGNVVLELEAMDVSELREFGWEEPETFQVKAADGVTPIFGNMWKPFDFDPDERYPVIVYVYPGPQQEGVRTTFGADVTEQQLAQLGFIVVHIGNRGGTPLRSAAYHSHGYFNLRDYGLPDKKAGVSELANRHSWIDLDRVGIYGHSGGGFMTAAALLVPPYNDFFHVGVSSAGNHDNNVYNQSWSERHHGLEVACVPPEEDEDAVAEESGESGEGSDDEEERETRVVANETHCEGDEEIEFDIEVPTNHEKAENLKGRLLLQHGDMDSNVHHAGTMRLVRELIEHDKRFDFMMFPGMRHGFGEDFSDYWNRARAEYFAEHLLGDYYRGSADINDH